MFCGKELENVAAPWLILGLGNPGVKYNDTLHNVGRETVELLASRQRTKFRRHRSGALVANTHFGVGTQQPMSVMLAVATTYMNVSGPQYAVLARTFKVPLTQILAVQDDLDLDPHTLRLKKGGGEGGHNGLRSLSGALGTNAYCRLRIGIGRPPGSQDPARYVLSPIPKRQRKEWDTTLLEAVEVLQLVVADGFVKTQMNLHAPQ